MPNAVILAGNAETNPNAATVVGVVAVVVILLLIAAIVRFLKGE
jgi:hypothetical protein